MIGIQTSRNEITIKGGYRLAEKIRKVLMMMTKGAKLGWARPGAGQEQGRNRAGAELSRVKQSRAERGQDLVRIWGGARNVPDRSLKGAGQDKMIFTTGHWQKAICDNDL